MKCYNLPFHITEVLVQDDKTTEPQANISSIKFNVCN